MEADVAVIGGGPSGAAAATLLARAGRRVILVERRSGPHDKVCGEFISGEAAAYLAGLGIDLARLGAASIRQVRLIAGERLAEASLPFRAFGLSRRLLDEALMQRAAESGATLARGVRASGLERGQAAWRVTLDDGRMIEAPSTFLAVGKHDLKGLRRPKGLQNDFVSFKMHWRLAPDQAKALTGAVELALFPHGYAGLQPVEGGMANLCLVARRASLGKADAWRGVLTALRGACPPMDRRLQGAEPLWGAPLAIAAIPYGHVQRRADGLWRLGDQAAVVPSCIGDGLALALHSAHAATYAWRAGRTPEAFQAALARELAWPVVAWTTLSGLLVQPWAQAALVAAAEIQPRAMTWIARRTRLANPAILRATEAKEGLLKTSPTDCLT